MGDLRKLHQAMMSMDLVETYWTQELPRLPVPDLWLTASRYLASLKAILAPSDGELRPTAGDLSLEELEAKKIQFERTDQIVRQFMLNEGPDLQRDLREYANKCQNWDMYLSNPLPLPVNSNPFFLFPRQYFSTSTEMLMFATRLIQFSVDFKFKIDQQTLRQDFGSGHGKGKPLCMETYKNFFHSYRMPHEDTDRLLLQSRRSNHIVVASCNQFYILRFGQDPLEDPYKKESSGLLNEEVIYEQLSRIYRCSREQARRELYSNSGENSIPRIGLFTTENRKRWAQLHKKLIHCNRDTSGAEQSCSNLNLESLRQIEDCLFVMCLDSLVDPTLNEQNYLRQPRDTEAANVILTGGGSHLFTANRWFDKFLQIIVGRNGACGLNIEHSASEGITILRFIEDFLEFIRQNPVKPATIPEQADDSNNGSSPDKAGEQPTNNEQPGFHHYSGSLDQADASDATNESNLPSEDFDRPAALLRQPSGGRARAISRHSSSNKSTTSTNSMSSAVYEEPESPRALIEQTDQITPIKWQLDDDLRAALVEAQAKVDKLIGNFSLYILNFEHFGRNFIKNQNFSPDAFIQLALQYSFFKIHGHLVSTYESASLRQFKFGRVDNIRANTCEAYEWIQVMLRCRAAPVDEPTRWSKAELSFHKAITKQVEILRYTITGGGPDNHLLALRRLANFRYDDDLPELFTDPSYADFLNFRLSTSQLPNQSGITVGYGAVTPDGYGCSYNPQNDRVVFCIGTFADCPATDSTKFARMLKESLIEMQQLCLGRSTQRRSSLLAKQQATQ